MIDGARTLDDLLRTEPEDSGCSAGADLDLYAEFVLSGQDLATAFPAWATHIRTCPACRADFTGLLEAACLFAD